MQATTSHVLRNEAGEFEIEMPPPVAMNDLPPALASTLQHIVGKLDMMTQVIGMVEERLSLNEDKMGQLQTQVLALADARPQQGGGAVPEQPEQEKGPSQMMGASEVVADAM